MSSRPSEGPRRARGGYVETLAVVGETTYVLLTHPSDVDRVHISGFDFFRGLGIIDYAETFKAWLRKFPRPVLVAALAKRDLIGWVHVDVWKGGRPRDGNAIYVLRAIEVRPEMRRRKIGLHMILLALRQTTGHMLVKPLNPIALKVFTSIGFQNPSDLRNPPVDMRAAPGHLILTAYHRRDVFQRYDKYLTGSWGVKIKPEDSGG